MSRLDTNRVFEIPIITREDYYAIKVPSDKGRDKVIIITSLTEEEDKALDKGETIIIERGKHKFLVEHKNIYCYGEIDFTNGSEDMEIISDFNWYGNSGADYGFHIPANYDYEAHRCYSPSRKPMFYDTFSVDRITQYCHAFIGKPKMTIIFKMQL